VVKARNVYGVHPLMVRRIVGERDQVHDFSFRLRSVERETVWSCGTPAHGLVKNNPSFPAPPTLTIGVVGALADVGLETKLILSVGGSIAMVPLSQLR
jgi:hypothetical protein